MAINDWEGKIGYKYTDRNIMTPLELEMLYRNRYGINRSRLNSLFLCELSYDSSVLEVGANIGLQLALLRGKFFAWDKIHGIEINEYAVSNAIIDCVSYGNVFNIHYDDKYFDLVFTSGLLIHIRPDQLEKAMKEIIRCSSRYVWGFEYYAPECTTITYREHEDLLWKNDFAQLYRDLGLKTVKEMRLRHVKEDLWDTMFLMQK